MSNRMKINPKKIGAVLLLCLALTAFGEVVFMYRLLSFIDWLYVLAGLLLSVMAGLLWRRS